MMGHKGAFAKSKQDSFTMQAEQMTNLQKKSEQLKQHIE